MQMRARLNPARPARGETFKLQLLLQHPMESGFRLDAEGNLISAEYVDLLEVYLDEDLLVQMQPSGGVAANPALTLAFKAERSGQLRVWYRSTTGDHGEVTLALAVS